MGLSESIANRKPESFDVDAYLNRIGVERKDPSAKYLKELHYAHLISVPYENLDVHYGRKIELRLEEAFKKVVINQRGGISYELNLLFYHLLIELGFSGILVSARHYKTGSLSPEFDHVVIIIQNVEGKDYLCDVGFGESFHYPKLLETYVSQLDYTKYYRFEIDIDGLWHLKESNDNSNFTTYFQFELKGNAPIEFIPRCNWLQENIQSWLHEQKFITKLFREGRITLTDRKLSIQLKGEQKELDIFNEDAFLSQLEQHFGIRSTDLLRQLID